MDFVIGIVVGIVIAAAVYWWMRKKHQATLDKLKTVEDALREQIRKGGGVGEEKSQKGGGVGEE